MVYESLFLGIGYLMGVYQEPTDTPMSTEEAIAALRKLRRELFGLRSTLGESYTIALKGTLFQWLRSKNGKPEQVKKFERSKIGRE